MKIILSSTKMLAALLMAGAAFTACSDTDIIVEVMPDAARSYKMTVDASFGEGAQTRALYFNSTSLDAKWASTDQVSVFPAAWSRTAYGTLTAAESATASTTLSGQLTTLPAAGDHLNLLFPRATWDYTGQTGSLLNGDNAIQKKFDYAVADVEVNSVSGNAIATTTANFTNQQAIVKFTLQKQNGDALNASSLTISAASNKLVTAKGYVVNPTRHTGYTCDGGTDGYDPASKLVDGNKTGTKWCVGNEHKSGGIWYCEFHTASAVTVDGYQLTTGHDNFTHNDRTPKDWVLKAKANSSDAWTTIATVTNDATLEDKAECTPYDFFVDVPGEYQYFRFEVSATRGDNVMQLEELELFKCDYGTAYGSLTVTPASATSEMTVALRNEKGSADTYSLAANVGGTTYSYSKSGVNFQNGKYYTVTVKMNNAPQYANDAIEVFQHTDPRLDEYMMGYLSYTHITLDQAYALAKYLGTTTGNTVAVVYDNDYREAKYALSIDASATAHQEMGDMLFEMYHYHVYLVP